jgi:formylglycine-generating enzyme required for sulfatase activity
MNHDVFISYSSKNKQVADAMCHVLEEHKIRCWIAPRDIPHGADYGDVIDEAIVNCKVFVILFSEQSAVSPWVKGELNLAFTEQKKIFPFRIDDTKMKGAIRVMLNQTHWVDAFPKPEEKFGELAEEISNVLGKPYEIDSLRATDKAEKVEQKLNLEQERLRKEREELEQLRKQLAEQNRLEEERKKMQAEKAKLEKELAGKRLIAETQKKQNSQSSHTENLNGVDFEMIKVQGGTFWMGAHSKKKGGIFNKVPDENIPNYDEDAYDSESPVHQVTLSDFAIGKYPVTQAQWKAVMGSNPSYFKGDDLPVENVSWDNCQEFILKLNAKTGKTFRLPTEAEWEYAARGGNKSNGYKYSGGNILVHVAWCNDNSNSKAHTVGTRRANELGIYDMSGNVLEWCSDWYGSYSSGSQTNPTGPSSGSIRVLRGGSWSSSARYCRVSNRYCDGPDSRNSNYGFRLILV